MGKYIGYICKDGFEKADGDENRACLRDGTLTGKPLVCLSKYNNNNKMPMMQLFHSKCKRISGKCMF